MTILEQGYVREYENILKEGFVQSILYPEFYEAALDAANFEESLVALLTTPKTRKNKNTPRGYYNWSNDDQCYKPYPEVLCGLLKILYEFRYTGKRSIRDSLHQANVLFRESPGIEYDLTTVGGLSNLLLRLEQSLGLTQHETSVDRVKKVQKERWIRAKEEGKSRIYNYSSPQKKKIAKRKQLTATVEELRLLKAKEKRLKAKAARQAFKLRLSGDPTKLGGEYRSAYKVLELLVSYVPDLVKPPKLGAPSVIIPENLIHKYNFMLANQYSDAECMEIYKEIINGEHKYDERKVAFLPTPRQYRFLAAPEDIVLYGGAAGGGKSFSMVIDPLRYVHSKYHSAVIIRKSMPELRELIDTARELYSMLPNPPKYKETEHTFHFPSGAKIWFSFLERPADKYRYQGQAYTYIGFDELSQHDTDEGFTYLRSRLRRPLKAKEIQPYIRATANPGSQWVYDFFIAPAAPETPFVLPGTENSLHPRTVKFIPAKLEDNPHLDDDGMYRSILESLPEIERRQLLDGDWLASKDNMFTEFDIQKHVVEPFYVPKHWNRVAGLDYGYRDPSAAVWFAVNPDDNSIVIYNEFLETGLTGKEFALAIKAREAEELVYVDHPIDWSVFARTGHTGPTIAESMLQVPGFRIRKADKNREAGWVQVHEYLRSDPKTGRPKIQVFSSCVGLIRQLISAKVSKTKPGDINDARTADGHWDLLDALRYGLMSRPRTETLDQRLTMFKQQNRWGQINNYFK
jgi:hypothetical protein